MTVSALSKRKDGNSWMRMKEQSMYTPRKRQADIKVELWVITVHDTKSAVSVLCKQLGKYRNATWGSGMQIAVMLKCQCAVNMYHKGAMEQLACDNRHAHISMQNTVEPGGRGEVWVCGATRKGIHTDTHVCLTNDTNMDRQLPSRRTSTSMHKLQILYVCQTNAAMN